jgi:hypothetical protein
MCKQDKHEVDRFGSSSPTRVSAVSDPGLERDIRDQTALAGLTRRVSDFGRLSRLAVRIAMCIAGPLLFVSLVLTDPIPVYAQVSVGISVAFAPPALPIYVQTVCPDPNYIWIPGYWAWDPDVGYYWVPGTWVPAPEPGWLWTPGYWGWDNGAYIWNEGYWGPEVGFYGGVNYGFGYNGYGYYGGYWDKGIFHYNRAVNNIRTTNIRAFYSKPVPRSATTSRVSFNGGHGGIALRPTAAQVAARRKVAAPIAAQREHQQAARRDPRLRASANHGRPAIAATPRPGAFSGSGIVRASREGAPYKAPSPAHAAPLKTPEKSAKPGPTEKRQPITAPRREAPVAPRARPSAPLNEPSRPTFKQNVPQNNQPRPNVKAPPMEHQRAPEQHLTAPHPNVPHAEPERKEEPAPPSRGGREREEGRP